MYRIPESIFKIEAESKIAFVERRKRPFNFYVTYIASRRKKKKKKQILRAVGILHVPILLWSRWLVFNYPFPDAYILYLKRRNTPDETLCALWFVCAIEDTLQSSAPVFILINRRVQLIVYHATDTLTYSHVRGDRCERSIFPPKFPRRCLCLRRSNFRR